MSNFEKNKKNKSVRGKSVFSRFAFVMLFLLSVTSVSHAGAGLFGSVEFRGTSIEALPKWVRVLDEIETQTTDFAKCDSEMEFCEPPSLLHWRQFMFEEKQRVGPVTEELVQSVNTFVNQWAYVTDDVNWGKSDYWASPLEFLEHSGDCEDYAILKYISLKELGVKSENLRIVVVQDTVRNLAHAVLAVYLEGKEPLILDSLFDAVLPHGEVLQYQPYYSVNENARWAHIMPVKREAE